MNISKKAFLVALASVGSVTTVMAESDKQNIYEVVKFAVFAEPKNVIAIVEQNVTATPEKSCEIVKAAIVGSNADIELVAKIVDKASSSAPEHARIIAQCAIAVAPDALEEIQKVSAKYLTGSGSDSSVSYSAKSDASEKSAKGAVMDEQQMAIHNVLDFPMGSFAGLGISSLSNFAGPLPGDPGGFPLFEDPLTPPSTTPPPKSTD